MRERGEGSAGRRSAAELGGHRLCWLLAVVSLPLAGLSLAALSLPLAGLSGCTNTSSASEGAPRELAKADPPAQVVQRMAPAPAATAATAASPPAQNVASSANPARPVPDKRAGGQAVTIKHLEAELNRLEADLK